MNPNRRQFYYHLILVPILALLVWTLPALAEKHTPSPVQETYKVLSTHETDAVFTGTREQPCRFRTAQCPDHCNHGGTVAEFTITRYISYKKNGKYGDPKTKKFSIMLKSPDMDQAMIDQIKKLTPGTPLKLSWEHRYISRTTENGATSKFPRRVITKLSVSPLAP